MSETITLTKDALRTTQTGFGMLLASALSFGVAFICVVVPMAAISMGWRCNAWWLPIYGGIGLGVLLWIASKIALLAFEDTKCRALAAAGLVLDIGIIVSSILPFTKGDFSLAIFYLGTTFSYLTILLYQARLGRLVSDQVLVVRSRRLFYGIVLAFLLILSMMVMPSYLIAFLPFLALFLVVTGAGQCWFAFRRVSELLRLEPENTAEGAA